MAEGAHRRVDNHFHFVHVPARVYPLPYMQSILEQVTANN